MAADDEIPRGWVLYAAPGTGIPSVTVPAIKGITHVIDHVDIMLFPTGAQTFEAIVWVIQDGAAGPLLLESSIFVYAQNTPSDDSWDGEIAGSQGGAVFIYANAGISSGGWGQIRVAGHDI